MEFSIIRNIIYLAIILISCVIGLCNFKLSNKVFKLLTCFSGYTFISETIAQVSSHVNKTNAFVHKIYLPVHLIFFCSIYYYLFQAKSWKIRATISSAILFVLIVIYEKYQEKLVLPAYGIMLEGILLVVFSILYFFQLIKNPIEGKLTSLGEFWLNSSVLFYFSGTFLFWATFNYFYFNKLSFMPYMMILWVLNIIHYSILGLSLLMHVRGNLSSHGKIKR